MNAEKLKQIQAPLKARYADDSASALDTQRAVGKIDCEGLTCHVETHCATPGMTTSSLHIMAGGDGSHACAGDMLLQSLVACSGVTFAAVSTAMGLTISSASVEARGTMDFRGTLGVDREAPVGLTSIELIFDISSDEPDEKIDKLIQLTERYCVVLQTISKGANVSCQRR
ncbi:OsmC family protein [Fuerstiella marisgermanici]|uniref:OsmC-like protein n=1 Tax=Fuerstiella marisgermanici TaxID=1891926 RepID=A0A1P8WS19_9PLAN|nr:OsmC family protein [Fuerstiella marisgermanici]APZ96854.1 OsmC-like protein [Fuerstiella marisgermanici]